MYIEAYLQANPETEQRNLGFLQVHYICRVYCVKCPWKPNFTLTVEIICFIEWSWQYCWHSCFEKLGTVSYRSDHTTWKWRWIVFLHSNDLHTVFINCATSQETTEHLQLAMSAPSSSNQMQWSTMRYLCMILCSLCLTWDDSLRVCCAVSCNKAS